MCKLNNNIIRFFCILGLLSFSYGGFAQSKNDLEKKKKQLKKEIKLINGMLKETRKNKEHSLDELLKLKSRLNARSGLINTMSSEVKLISQQIKENGLVITSLENDIVKLKAEYAKMIYYAFMHKNSYDKVMFVFASKNFNQAYKRLKYIQQYSEYRKSQADLIIKTQQELVLNIAELKNVKQEKSVLISLEEDQKQQLAVEKQEQEGVVKKLQGQEEGLKSKLRKKEQAAKKLQKAIQRIITEEIRKAREAAKKSGTTSKGFPMSPEAKKLSSSFASNKGKLPWPVAEGVITAKFGKHPHPVLEGIVVNNNGIDISTKKGAIAQAIFNGKVSSVAIIPGEGKVVMVRHGEYLSVYSYMSKVFVKKGDKITTKQQLGILINSSEGSKTDIHLEIWKGMTKLNPQYWILRR
jgi:murein hydrolase activator